MMSRPNLLTPPYDLRRQMHCKTCRRLGRPLLRKFGMPAVGVDWERHEQEGRYRIMGCCVEPDEARYECRHCGTPTFLADRVGE